MKYKIDVYIVDDHVLLNDGLTDVINQSDTMHVSRCFTTLGACRKALAVRTPDVLLLDISMPDGDGAIFCQWVVSEYPKVRILAVTIHDEYCIIRRMLESGVHGYVLKSASISELTMAIEQVWRGNRYISPAVESILEQSGSEAIVLTKPERSILRLVCDGRSNAEIADELNLSPETIKWYRKRLLAKFGVKNTVCLVKRAIEQGVC